LSCQDLLNFPSLKWGAIYRQVHGQQRSRCDDLRQGRMLGTDGEVTTLQVAIARIKVRSFVSGLGKLADDEEQLSKQNDTEQRQGQPLGSWGE
jgi:hypothetical protein